MKELSIEEKAKRYDEAYKKVAFRFGSNVADEIFLKESDDERIRKEIVDFATKANNGVTSILANNYNFNKWIAWLEKQGSDSNKEYWRGYREGKQEVFDKYAELEKQGGITKLSDEEQNKFAKGVLTSCALSFIDYLDAHKYEDKMCVSNGECEDIENAFHNAMWDRLHRYYCKYIEKQGEQKPYGQREECLDCQFNYAGECKGSCAMKRGEQKPAWSEEDEMMLEGTINKISDLGTGEMCKEWLKSLKERYTWKPSDEQMNALNYVVNLMASSERPTENDLYYNILKSLRQQLMKLKE